MYGFQAIAHYNGWAMAVAGALIVMFGLGTLSFIISQFPRIIGLFERKKEAAAVVAPPTGPQVPDRCPADINETARMVRQFTVDLGDEFYLAGLYNVCQEKNLPHPHLTIKCLREAGLLVSKGEGVFAWKN